MPKADDETVTRIQKMLVDEPGIVATEVLRCSRAWGYTGSRSAERLREVNDVRPSDATRRIPSEALER